MRLRGAVAMVLAAAGGVALGVRSVVHPASAPPGVTLAAQATAGRRTVERVPVAPVVPVVPVAVRHEDGVRDLRRGAAPDPELRMGRSLPCRSLAEPDEAGRFLAREDLLPPLGPVSGDDLLTIVNRSPRFVLGADYAPTDLVDLATGVPASPEVCLPPDRQCLRRPAAEGLRRMLDAMAAAGVPGHIHSAFRSFGAQCGVFRKWAYDNRQGFCRSTTSSALAGHSQHQLGTAIDLFTREWAQGGTVMRPGFGRTAGGRWLAAHAWEYGFVLPYPPPEDPRAGDEVDPRTGYRYEPWHLRYLGVENAARFHAAGGAITLEQWLRREHGLDAGADLPVCDGCACGLCATFHVSGRGVGDGPCGDRALVLGADGEPLQAAAPPRVESVEARSLAGGVRVVATVEAPLHTVTQTPSQAPGDPRAYPDLRGAWRLAVAPVAPVAPGAVGGAAEWPWRAALRDDAESARLNGANLRLPAGGGRAGRVRVVVVVPRAAPEASAWTRLRVALVREGVAADVHEVPIREPGR